ncbi:hypothetical protein G6L99_19120 [Agrobacterium rhizogenes]|uniref:hypothetical protein n=1 Tax=Rhizobium rhizogenes TaxID=359 RepID=UPI001571FE45|nr:hypothetical protein [Rhizobium rhizogenes]NTH14235.1 hypothetical protein [Rhizobium rhizogenes]
MRDFRAIISDNVALEVLDAWFGVQDCSYRGANFENIPWIIAHFAPTMDLFGRDLIQNASLMAAIAHRVPQAAIKNSRLVKGKSLYGLGLSALHHNPPQRGVSSGVWQQR